MTLGHYFFLYLNSNCDWACDQMSDLLPCTVNNTCDTMCIDSVWIVIEVITCQHICTNNLDEYLYDRGKKDKNFQKMIKTIFWPG